MGLDDVVPVEVGHLSPALDPDLILAVLGEVVEAGDVESELTAFGELADEDSCRKKFLPGDVAGHIGDGAVNEENSVFDESEHWLFLGPVDEVLQGISDVLVEFGEKHLGFLIGQRSHQQSSLLL